LDGPIACDAPTVTESELQEATLKVINQLVHCSDSVLQTLTKNIERVLAEDSSEGMERINMLMKEKQKELFILARAKKD
jgi:hypothetical protein